MCDIVPFWRYPAGAVGLILVAALLSSCGGQRLTPQPSTPQPGMPDSSGRMATSQSQRQIAVFGDTGKDLSDRVAAAEHAGLHPQYVAVSAPQKRYLYSVYAQVLRTQQAIIVRAYGLIYVFPQKTTTVSLSGTPVNTADLPSVDMPFVDAAIRAGKQPGQFAFGNVMKKRQICADCVVLASDHPSPQLTAQKLAALWNGKLDPWQTSTAYLPWAPPGKKSVGPDFSNPPHGGGSNPPPEYCGSCGSGGYTGDGPPGGGGGGHPTPPPRYTNWSSSKCSSVQNAMKAAGQSMYLPSTRSGNEYGAIAATDPSGGIHYSGNLTGASGFRVG